jgi:hypothetical protein
VIEDHQRNVLLLELRSEALSRAAAEIEGGIRTRAPDDLAQGRRQPGGTCQGIEFIEAVCVEPLAVDRNRKQCDVRRDGIAGGFVAGGIRFQLSGLSWWKSTARAGTTVEMACL